MQSSGVSFYLHLNQPNKDKKDFFYTFKYQIPKPKKLEPVVITRKNPTELEAAVFRKIMDNAQRMARNLDILCNW